MKLDRTTSRSTRARLLKAMGLSSCLVTSLLAVLGLLVEIDTSKFNRERLPEITVIVQTEIHRARQNSEESDIENSALDFPHEQSDIVEIAAGSQATETFVPDNQVGASEPDETVVNMPPPTDWHSMARFVAREHTNEHYGQRETRSKMWQQSRSIMFQPIDENLDLAEKPILAKVNFKLRSRVFGLGLNIGSCFIGIPIAGVDVEARSMGPTVFICGQGS